MSGNTAGNLASLATSAFGITGMNNTQFNPAIQFNFFSFFLNLAVVILVAMVIGGLTEIGIDKLKDNKKKHEMGGSQ